MLTELNRSIFICMGYFSNKLCAIKKKTKTKIIHFRCMDWRDLGAGCYEPVYTCLHPNKMYVSSSSVGNPHGNHYISIMVSVLYRALNPGALQREGHSSHELIVVHRTRSLSYKIIWKPVHVSNGNSKFAMFFWNVVCCEKAVLLDRFVIYIYIYIYSTAYVVAAGTGAILFQLGVE